MTQRSRAVALAFAAALALAGGVLSAVSAHADDEPDPAASPSPIASESPAVSVPPTDPDPAIPVFGSKPPVPAGDEAPPGSAAPAAVPYDGFAHAAVVTGYFPYAHFDNRAASIEHYEPRGIAGGWLMQRTVWASWLAPGSGVVTVTTSASGGENPTSDTAVNVYTGSSIRKLTRVGSNDQQFSTVAVGTELSGGPGDAAAILSLRVKKGTVYRFQLGATVSPANPSATVDGWADLAFHVQWGLYDMPNDDFADAQPLSLLPGGTVQVETLLDGTRLEAWESAEVPGKPSIERTGSVWYSFTSPASGAVTVSSCAESAPSTIQAYGPSMAGGVDWGDLAGMGFASSASNLCWGSDGTEAVLTIPVSAGRTYRFQVAATHQIEQPGIGMSGQRTRVTITQAFSSPWLAKVTPASGALKGGTRVTLTGAAFTDGMGAPVVRFGSKIAPATSTPSPTATSITVTVPKGTKKGRVAVTVTVGGATSNVGYYTYR